MKKIDDAFVAADPEYRWEDDTSGMAREGESPSGGPLSDSDLEDVTGGVRNPIGTPPTPKRPKDR